MNWARRWGSSASMLFAGVVFLIVLSPSPVLAVLLGLVVLALVWVYSPHYFPRTRSDSAARQAAEAGNVPLIYWRPGCSYCMRMRTALGTTGNRAVWVDVSQDGDASARVRSVNDGNETVPTVFVGARSWTNPSPSAVREMLGAS